MLVVLVLLMLLLLLLGAGAGVFFSGEGVAGADAGTGAYCANAVSGVVKFPNPLAIGSESDIHGSWGT